MPQALSSSARLKIYVRFEKKQKPYFKQQNEEIAFFGIKQQIPFLHKASLDYLVLFNI